MQLQSADGQFGKALKLYRPQVALQIQAVRTEKDNASTVNIEMSAGTSHTYDWQGKTTLQVSLAELPLVCSVLLGLVPSTTHKYHGESKNKGYEVSNADANRKLSVFSPSGRLFFSFTPVEAFYMAEFCVDALQLNFERMTKTDLMNLLKQTVAKR